MSYPFYNRAVNHLTFPPYDKLFADVRIRQYPRGQIIMYAGDEPLHAYMVKSGAVKIYDINDNNEEKVLHIGGPGAILPAVYLFGQAPQTATFYATLMDCELYMLPIEEFNARLLQNNDLALACVRWFAGEVREMMIRMASLQKSDTKERLLVTLWYLARLHTQPLKNSWCRVNFPVTHQLLADMIGVSRESTSIALKEFHKQRICRSPKLSKLEINLAVIKKTADKYQCHPAHELS